MDETKLVIEGAVCLISHYNMPVILSEIRPCYNTNTLPHSCTAEDYKSVGSVLAANPCCIEILK